MIPTVFTPAFTMWPTSASADEPVVLRGLEYPSLLVVHRQHDGRGADGRQHRRARLGHERRTTLTELGEPEGPISASILCSAMSFLTRITLCVASLASSNTRYSTVEIADLLRQQRGRVLSAECRPPRSRRSTRRSRRSSIGPTPAPRPARWRAQWNAGRWVSCAGSSLSTDRRLLACVAGILPNERNARAFPGALRRTAPRAAYRGTRARRRASRARGPRPPAFASTASRSEVSPIFSTASANSSVSPTLLGARKSHSTCAIGIPCRSSV